MIRWLLVGFLAAAFAGCNSSSRKESVNEITEADSTDTEAIGNFAGTWEYSNPWPAGYLFYRLTLTQDHESLTGKLTGGNYLSASEAGGYVNPNVTIECAVQGEIENGTGTIYLTVLQHDRSEQDAPDLMDEMNFPDLDEKTMATSWKIMIVNGALHSENGKSADGVPVDLEWEKLP